MDAQKLPPKLPATSDCQLRYGTIGEGIGLIRLALSAEHHVFPLQDTDLQKRLPKRPRTQELPSKRSQVKATFLNKNPVDVLLIDEGNKCRKDGGLDRWIAHTHDQHLPKVIVVAGSSLRHVHSPSVLWRKLRRKSLAKRGYQAVEWLLNSQDYGAALDQERVFDVYYSSPSLSTRPPTRPTAQGLPPRSMSNLLTPPGLVPRAAKTSGGHFTWNPDEVGPDPPEGPLCLATGPEGHVYSPAGCMVDTLKGQFIATEQGV